MTHKYHNLAEKYSEVHEKFNQTSQSATRLAHEKDDMAHKYHELTEKYSEVQEKFNQTSQSATQLAHEKDDVAHKYHKLTEKYRKMRGQLNRTSKLLEHQKAISERERNKAANMTLKYHEVEEQFDQAGEACKWSDQRAYCELSTMLDDVQTADECRVACCHLGWHACTVWQFCINHDPGTVGLRRCEIGHANDDDCKVKEGVVESGGRRI